MVPCRITIKFSVDLSTIVVHFISKCIRGPATKSPPLCLIFASSKKDGDQIEQQNPKCKQLLLFATPEAPENHGCTLRCGFSSPNLVVLFPLGQQSAPRYLGVQNLAPIFGLESVVHGGPLQHVL
jgi:hypothetical protein